MTNRRCTGTGTGTGTEPETLASRPRLRRRAIGRLALGYIRREARRVGAPESVNASPMLSTEEYDTHDATALAALVRRGETTPDELLDVALAIARERDPALRMLAHLDEGAARRRIAAGLPDGPLAGVPFLLKDLGAESVDFPSGGGSRLLANTRHPRDSTLVRRLNAAGLVTFGRTTAPEGGIGPATESALYGAPTRNPWDRSRTAGGSSGGAGAAVAAGVVPAAHGSDGGGSVRIPASCCGLFGFKATRARLPDGPYAGEGWAGMAIDGFLSRSVRDSAALLDAVAGADQGAPYHAPPLRRGFVAAVPDVLPRLRVGLVDTAFDGTPIDPAVREAVHDAARLLEDLGHRVEPLRLSVDVAGMTRAWTAIVACGTAVWIDAALARLGRALPTTTRRAPRPLGTGARAHDFGSRLPAGGRDRARLRPRDGRVVFAAEPSTGEASAVLGGAEPVATGGASGASVLHTLAGDAVPGVDVLLCATLAEPPARVGRFAHDRPDYVDYRLGADGVFAHSPFTAVFNASGQPAASLPLHWTPEGPGRPSLPIGVQLACAFGEDERLMSLCAELEAARPWFGCRAPRADASTGREA